MPTGTKGDLNFKNKLCFCMWSVKHYANDLPYSVDLQLSCFNSRTIFAYSRHCLDGNVCCNGSVTIRAVKQLQKSSFVIDLWKLIAHTSICCKQ